MPKLLAFNSIRFKLTLVYSTVICVTLALFALVVYRSVIVNLEREIDNDLLQRAEQASTYFSNSGFNGRELEEFARNYGGASEIPRTSLGSDSIIKRPPETDNGDLASALTYLQLVTRDGTVVQRLPQLKVMAKPETQQALAQTLKEGPGYSYLKLATGERARVYTMPLDRGVVENRGYVQVVRGLQESDSVIKSLSVPIAIFSMLAIFTLGVFGWWLTRRVFAPIEEITATAYRIGVNNDLAERIKTDPTSNDEVSRLGRAFNAMLERLEKSFKAQKQFIADSSHELRTPLTVIRGNVDLLKRNPDPQNQVESLQAIERESARMQRLVQDLLLLAQADARQTVELMPLQLNDLVLEIFKETRVLADQRRQQLKLDKFDPVEVEGDADRLKRAILNLVDNAIKYTPEEGVITLSLIRGKEWARIVVSDNGPGIAAKDQALVFDRFYRVDKARNRALGAAGGGTGLGLAIVKHIVEAHGGRITLESEQGKGSTFTIWLKVADTLTLDGDPADEVDETSDAPNVVAKQH